MIITFAKLIIVWSQTLVTIPLDDNVEDYKYLPEAVLMLDGEKVTDTEMYYEYAVNRTFFSVISTKVVSEYRIDYRVHFPTYNKSGDQTIIFRVVDEIKPTIVEYKDHYIPLGEQTYDLTLGLKYEDNYDPSDKLKLDLIGKQQINYKKVGTYELIYRVTDLSKNYTEQKVNIYIYDSTPPTIQQTKPVVLNIGSKFVYTQFFEVKDNYDQVLNVFVSDEHVNYQKPGYYQVKLTARDQSNQSTYVMFDLYIYDLEPPKLTLSQQQISWNIKTEISKDDLRLYIAVATDNYDSLSHDDVDIEHSINVLISGTYQVTYTLTDKSNNSTIQTLKVVVKDITPPEIEFRDIKIEVFEQIPYFPDYVTITDNIDDFDRLTITYTGKVDNKNKGTYEIKIKAVDSEKNETIKTMKVYVVDTTAPSIKLLENIVIINFSKPDYNKYFDINDLYDKSVKVFFDDSKVDYNEIGTYELYVSASDESGNEVQLITIVEIIDTTTPILELYNESIVIMFGEKIELRKYIKSAYDVYDSELSMLDVFVESYIDESKTGLYEVSYSLKDKSQNEIVKTLNVYIKDFVPPVLEVVNPTLKKGEPFLFLNYAKASDNYDGEISHLIVLETKGFNTSKKGIYKLLLSVTDSQGNTTFSDMEVTVTDETNLLIVIISILLSVIVTLIIGFIVKRKNVKNASF